MGHNRLINDLSPNGKQPFKRHGVTLICNGKLTHQIERKVSKKYGPYLSNSDNEVVLVCLEDELHLLDGCFHLSLNMMVDLSWSFIGWVRCLMVYNTQLDQIHYMFSLKIKDFKRLTFKKLIEKNTIRCYIKYGDDS